MKFKNNKNGKQFFEVGDFCTEDGYLVTMQVDMGESDYVQYTNDFTTEEFEDYGSFFLHLICKYACKDGDIKFLNGYDLDDASEIQKLMAKKKVLKAFMPDVHCEERKGNVLIEIHACQIVNSYIRPIFTAYDCFKDNRTLQEDITDLSAFEW